MKPRLGQDVLVPLIRKLSVDKGQCNGGKLFLILFVQRDSTSCHELLNLFLKPTVVRKTNTEPLGWVLNPAQPTCLESENPIYYPGQLGDKREC